MSDWNLKARQAWPETGCQGWLREQIEDFVVEEVLGIEPDDQGEHRYLWIEKTALNTDEVAQRIARLAKVRSMDVGYCGMKDRRAVARQWFSVYLSNRPEPDWNRLNETGIRLLEVRRHRQKLRRGQHQGNRFQIRLREISGDLSSLDTRLQQIAEQGFPNYFGAQRFGIQGANLDRAVNLFQGELRQRNPHKRGIYLSAARSYLFNQVLSKRVEAGSWSQMIDGDQCQTLIRSASGSEQTVPAGPLFGDGPTGTLGAALAIEQQVAEAFPLFINGLASQRTKPETRPLVAFAQDLNWDWDGQDLTLRFGLSGGSFATALLQECLLAEERWFQRERNSDDPNGDSQDSDES